MGAGSSYSAEWVNLDLARVPGVLFHDVREPLPFPDATFHAAYSSHVLEHLTPPEGRRLLAEMRRVLRPGGIVRVVVPDLERIARDYLERLERAAAGGEAEMRRLRWIKLELLDQMVRQEPGGQMLRAMREELVDREDAVARLGDELAPADAGPSGTLAARVRAMGPRGLGRVLAGRVVPALRSPQRTGEAHRWMYDRVELGAELRAGGFTDPRVVVHDESRIPDWDRYALDTSRAGDGPRKPDSLFMEATVGGGPG